MGRDVGADADGKIDKDVSWESPDIKHKSVQADHGADPAGKKHQGSPQDTVSKQIKYVQVIVFVQKPAGIVRVQYIKCVVFSLFSFCLPGLIRNVLQYSSDFCTLFVG